MPSHVALRYMAEFQCIGPACEDTCCANWQIEVDRRHFVKIWRLLARTPAGRERAASAFERVDEKEQSAKRYVLMKLTEDRACAFLDPDRLCMLHKQFGERLLPDVCAHYPRSISVINENMEMTGQLSCPEVTRRCITDARGTDLVPVGLERFARGHVRQTTRGEVGQRVLEVRESLLALADATRFPLASRLFFALCFGERIGEFYYRGVETFDGARFGFERQLIARPDIQDELHAEFEASRVPGPTALAVLARVLGADLTFRAGGPFRVLVDEVLDSYAPRDAAGVRGIDADALWMAYLNRREQRSAALPRVDAWLRNYCRHYFVRDWFVDGVDLGAYLRTLLIRVAVLRFLLISHPAVGDGDDAFAVRLIYSFTRALDHHSTFLELVREGLAEKLPTFSVGIALLKV